MISKHTIKKSNDLDDRLAGLVGMAQNYKADGYSDVQALEAALGDYERSSGRNIGYATLERLYQALEARGFSFPEEELEEATTRGGTKVKESAELTPGQLERIAVSSGYNPMTFLDAKRIGYRNGNPLYLLLSYDNNEDEYIVGKAEISRGKDATSRIDFDGNPDFFSASRAEAYDAFHTLADGGKLTEGKYAAGGRALQDDYDDIIEDVLSGWDVGDTLHDGMTLPTDALEQIEAALKAHDPSLGQTDVQDIIETYFEHSGALTGAPGNDATVGDIEDEAFELSMSGFPDEDVQHRLAQKHGLSRGEVRNILAYESKVSAKSSLRESSEKITWSSFDTPESNALEEKYLPDQGDGDNMASQAVTAATRLIYKWFNNGDVYDNSYGLSGWVNDISGSANWLAKHVPGARDILWRIQKTHSEEEYVSNILWPLFNLVYDSKLLSSLEKKPKVDDAYSCKGPFEFNYEDEDAYQEDFEESKKTSIGNLLREAAKPVQEDKLGAWYKSAFTNDRKATENKEGFYQVRESRVAKKPRVKESVPNWYEFQSDVFNAINEVYEKYNMGNAAEKIDKMDMIKVLTEWISMVTETKKDEKLL